MQQSSIHYKNIKVPATQHWQFEN